jgi:hypothetical protein
MSRESTGANASAALDAFGPESAGNHHRSDGETG